jgi:ABC-type multidrug transport system fused ATPase/permease subunit
MAFDFLDMAEELYRARLFVMLMSFFNIVVSLIALYTSFLSSSPWLTLIFAFVFLFDVLFFFLGIRSYRKGLWGERQPIKAKVVSEQEWEKVSK